METHRTQDGKKMENQGACGRPPGDVWPSCDQCLQLKWSVSYSVRVQVLRSSNEREEAPPLAGNRRAI